jgi:hypothetical protein
LALGLAVLAIPFSALSQNPVPINCGGGPSSAGDSHIFSVNLVGDGGTAVNYVWPTTPPNTLPGNGPTGVENRTDLVAALTPGQTYTVEFTLWARGFTQYTSNGAIWIDFNGDGTLTADELVHQTLRVALLLLVAVALLEAILRVVLPVALSLQFLPMHSTVR